VSLARLRGRTTCDRRIAPPAGIAHAALIGPESGLVVLLEGHTPRRELVHRLVEVIDEPAASVAGDLPAFSGER
jgi:hypothetical protein